MTNKAEFSVFCPYCHAEFEETADWFWKHLSHTDYEHICEECKNPMILHADEDLDCNYWFVAEEK